MTTLKHILLLAAATAGCQVDDADLEHGALATFALAPAATMTDHFSMMYTGSVTAGFRSEQPGTLIVKVDGQPVVQQAVDFSKDLTQALTIAVPLTAEGPNAVSAELDYEGATLSADSLVTVSMTAPTITIPTFNQTYTPHVGLAAAGTIQVSAAAGYTVTAVATSIDAGPWMPATANASGGWDATLVDPDIGDVDVAVRADVAVDGHSESTIAHAIMHVAPIFDCTQPATSMLPSTTLLATGFGGQATGENRVLIGYFGQPNRGHDASFILTGSAPEFQGSPVVSVVSSTVSYGTTEVHAAFSTGILRCNPNNASSCDNPYDLTVMVDGVVVCSTTGRVFGVVRSLQ